MTDAEYIHMLEMALEEHNGRLRSAYSIAVRKGEATNWDAFQARVHATLIKHHEISNRARAAIGGVFQ